MNTIEYNTSTVYYAESQLSDLAPEGGYARLAHTTQYIERETPPTATSTSAESNI